MIKKFFKIALNWFKKCFVCLFEASLCKLILYYMMIGYYSKYYSKLSVLLLSEWPVNKLNIRLGEICFGKMYFGTSTERLMMLLCSSVESSRASKAAEIGQRIFYSAQTFLDEKKVQSLSVNLTFCLPLRQQPLENPNLRGLAQCL